jgi:uncharacterized protein (DUF433 family)/DNA-binding transcriptional MerR regulator
LNIASNHNVFGIGAYSVPEVSRLLNMPAANVRRWVGGYEYRNANKAEKQQMPPLWRIQHPKYENHLELGFKDLIELKFIKQFMKAGLKIQTIRACLVEAQKVIQDSHPFATRQFESDGKTIFFKFLSNHGESQLLDLRRNQFVLEKLIEQSFKDLDIKNNEVSSWRPFKGKATIVVDPKRSFGQPVVTDFGVPTITLFQAVEAEGSIAAVSRWYEMPAQLVRDAVAFEKSLLKH